MYFAPKQAPWFVGFLFLISQFCLVYKGKVVAELLQEEETSTDMNAFSLK
jgi:hypothetical protein